MYRPQAASKLGTSNGTNCTGKQVSNENSPTTIKEIRSRTLSSASSNANRNLLANRRQAMSMERLNCGAMSANSAIQNSNSNDREKERGSASSGSSNSINGTSTTSPQRSSTGGGLNRTASRVSRFRSAKAVFERLSSANVGPVTKTDRPIAPEKPRGTVTSRYAASAAARATSHMSNGGSPRSRTSAGPIVRSNDSGKSGSNVDIHKSTIVSKSEPSHPRPQPRVISNRSASHSNSSGTTSDGNAKARGPTTPKIHPQIKPPPKDLIDKIVLEIARDASKENPDVDSAIQDLSNCDISGIPDTLDFEKCFQEVEMMTEEEARQLLSRTASISMPTTSPEKTVQNSETKIIEPITNTDTKESENKLIDDSSKSSLADQSSNQTGSSIKSKVRFSDEPVKIFSTHAIEDYDRRNDDIDPVAASAEYEIEKSKERKERREAESQHSAEIVGAVDQFITNQSNLPTSNNLGNTAEAPHDPQPASQSMSHDSSAHEIEFRNEDETRGADKEYIESLEREVSLKHILEQNLRDLQGQYYEAVKSLDDLKNNNEIKLNELEQDLRDLNNRLEISQNQASDAREQADRFEKQFNDIKDSSQMLEKKYHRAKRIIKDMQSREQSFTRREQLYQQKLDEIEFELGSLIETVNRTILEDGLKFYDTTDKTNYSRQCQARLDVFGLVRQILDNFRANQSTQNPQIKQRVISMLEQQLSNLMSNGSPAMVANGPLGQAPTSPSVRGAPSENLLNQQLESNKHSQNSSCQFAFHRLSQPNLPHPIGVSSQPTKLFHGLNPMPLPVSINEPSPPHSVNSYPSTNSLNSLNNNNHNVASNYNENVVTPSKLRERPSANDLHLNSTSSIVHSTTSKDDNFQPTQDIQVPFQTNEWHNKPVSEWTTTQVSTWLLALGLDQYISKFEDRNVNGQSLINLDSTVLKGLGVLNSNDRNLLKKKIRELRVEMERERKFIEKKMKGTLKDKAKNKFNGSAKPEGGTEIQQGKPSWKRSLLS